LIFIEFLKNKFKRGKFPFFLNQYPGVGFDGALWTKIVAFGVEFVFGSERYLSESVPVFKFSENDNSQYHDVGNRPHTPVEPEAEEEMFHLPSQSVNRQRNHSDLNSSRDYNHGRHRDDSIGSSQGGRCFGEVASYTAPKRARYDGRPQTKMVFEVPVNGNFISLSDAGFNLSTGKFENPFLRSFEISEEYVPLIPVAVEKWRRRVELVKSEVGPVNLVDFPVVHRIIFNFNCVSPSSEIIESDFVSAAEVDNFIVVLCVGDSSLTHWNMTSPKWCYMARCGNETKDFSPNLYGAADCSDLLLPENRAKVKVFQIAISGCMVDFGPEGQLITPEIVQEICLKTWGPHMVRAITLVVTRVGTNNIKLFYPNRRDFMDVAIIHGEKKISDIGKSCLRFTAECGALFGAHAYWLGCGTGLSTTSVGNADSSIHATFINDDRTRGVTIDQHLGRLNRYCEERSRSSFSAGGRFTSNRSTGAFALYTRDKVQVISGTGHLVANEYRDDATMCVNAIMALAHKSDNSFVPVFIKTASDLERWGPEATREREGSFVLANSRFDIPKGILPVRCMSECKILCPTTNRRKNVNVGVVRQVSNGFYFGTCVAIRSSNQTDDSWYGVIVDSSHKTYSIVADLDSIIRSINHNQVYTTTVLNITSQEKGRNRVAHLRKCVNALNVNLDENPVANEGSDENQDDNADPQPEAMNEDQS
jgi:hypothetical protein